MSSRVHAGEIIAGDLFGDVATVDTVRFPWKGDGVERVAVDPASVPRIAEELIDGDLIRRLYPALADKEAVAYVRAREQHVAATLLRHHVQFLCVNPRKLDLSALRRRANR